MKTNDRGIAVPGKVFPLPWAVIPDHTGGYVVAANGEEVFDVSRLENTADFQVIAANFHERMADIVRRLAEAEKWPDRMMVAGSALAIAEDAATLWAEYQEAVK